EERIPVHAPGSVAGAGCEFLGTILDVSKGGASFRPKDLTSAISEAQAITIHIPEIGRIEARIIAKGSTDLHVKFENLTAQQDADINRYIAAKSHADAKFIEAAVKTAGDIGSAFEAAIKQGQITHDAVFDVKYQPIPNTDPQQFTTRYLKLADSIFPTFLEPVLALDDRVFFCAALDRNGYLPTHNRKFSHPQRQGDPNWNATNCRNRRIFDDRGVLTSVRDRRRSLLQTHDRNMGGGQVVTLKEASSPIFVNGQHWGAVRLTYRT
ncbi:MAG TPA: PilZ domain-containing protein, partial [Xanthobacteraceae bacterium]|nr:PilZ domain-containing protein [Xanthobacteraceae bacterium]